MDNFWNDRYAAPEYLFGTDPAKFLLDNAAFVPPKGTRTLALADGEGRNSVWLAAQGMDVVAMEAAPNALLKARALAKKRGVSVDFRQSMIEDWDWTPNAFDLVAAICIQFMGPVLRDQVFAGMKRTLRPGGTLMLHGYTVEQLGRGAGGPPILENLYTRSMLAQGFDDMEVLRLETYERDVEEGRGHSGRSAMIDLVARKSK